MPAPLSVVLPTLNAARSLPACADALLPGLGAGLISELVVSDGGSTDRTADVAEALGARWVAGGPGWGACAARGAQTARAEWLLILDPAARLSDTWVDAVERHLATRPGNSAVFRLSIRADGPAPALAAAALELSGRLRGRPLAAQGLLIRRRDFPGRQRPVRLAATAHLPAEPFLDAGWLAHGLHLLRAG